MVARAGREGSRVERSKGLKESDGFGCALEVSGGAAEEVTLTDEAADVAQGLEGRKEDLRPSPREFGTNSVRTTSL